MTAPYRGLLIDLDGTIYLGKEKIPEAAKFIQQLKKQQIDFLFLTNNTTKTPAAVVENLKENHDIEVLPQQIYTPSLATVAYLQQLHGGSIAGMHVYIIGEIGLFQALLAAGAVLDEQHPDYVIVGLDYDVTYHKFELAVLAIQRGAKFIGTNADTNLPNERGLVPGGGSLIALVECATHQRAQYIGKPEKIIVEGALTLLDIPAQSALIVGDNYQTDIQAGFNAGVDTLLVYTGVSTPKQVEQAGRRPTYETTSLAVWPDNAVLAPRK